MNAETKFPKTLKHGSIQRIFDDLFFVTGIFSMPSRMPMAFSRNMTIIRQGDELNLVNTVRLSEDGLRQLDDLGKVTNVIRIAAFHGSDDPFYKERYGAKVWSIDAPYASGFNKEAAADDVYFHADVVVDESTTLPIENAQLVEFTSCKPREALLLLQRDNGIIVSGDCLQNWSKTDEYFSFFARVMMKMMGFIKPHNIGPGWLKIMAPDLNEVRDILNYDFDHVLPAHGQPVIGGAKELYGSTIQQLIKKNGLEHQ